MRRFPQIRVVTAICLSGVGAATVFPISGCGTVAKSLVLNNAEVKHSLSPDKLDLGVTRPAHNAGGLRLRADSLQLFVHGTSRMR